MSYLPKSRRSALGHRLAALGQRIAAVRHTLVGWRLGLALVLGVGAVIGSYAAYSLWKKSRIPAGFVAIVDGTAITKADIAAEALASGVDAAQLDAGATKQLLDRVVDRRLLAEAARKQGVADDPRYQSVRARADEMFLAGVVMRRFAGAPADASEAEGRQYMAAHPAMFADRQTLVVDAITCGATDLTASFRRQINDLEQVETYIRAAKLPVHRKQVVLDSAKLPPPVAASLATLEPGKVFILPQGRDILVGTIVRRLPNQAPPEVQLASAREAAGQQQVQARLGKALAELRTKAKITYGSR